MQVKISFTVDMEEVLGRVDKELHESIHQLTDIVDSDIGVLTRDNLLRKMEWIENIRKKMLKVDTRLSDCYSILVGYNKAVSESFLPQREDQEGQQDATSES